MTDAIKPPSEPCVACGDSGYPCAYCDPPEAALTANAPATASKPPSEVVDHAAILHMFVEMFKSGEQGCNMDCDAAKTLAEAIDAALTANAQVGDPFGYVIDVFGQKLFFETKYHDAARFYEKGGAKKITVYTDPPVAVAAPRISRGR